MKKKIDVNAWKRKSQFLFYKDFDQPFFNITAEVDVTNVLRQCKQSGNSFFLTSLFLSQKVVNTIDAFRYRIQGDEVVIYENVEAGSTILFEDNTFGFCYFKDYSELEVYLLKGEERIRKAKAKKAFLPEDFRDDLIHYSVVPWVSFTSLQHARNTKSQDSIPKIVFGKYYRDGDTMKMPISVSAHHALVDGYHVGRYFSKMEDLMKMD